MKELKESNGVSRISGANLLQAKQCRLPRIKWEIPSKFVLASDWYVVSGEDSEEKAVQKLRESTVLEALYHHSSTIPHNPFFPPGIENQYYDDRRTPLIPIIPIGEAEPTTVPPSNLSSVRQHPVAFHAAEGDESFAAIAAVTAIIKNIDRKSLIDTDLQIQSDPTMATKLINKYRLATDNVSIPSESNMPENAQLPQPRMSVGDALSLPVSKPSMFLSLKEDHGGHDHARNAHVAARTDPLLEKRKRDYRSPDNLQKNNNPATESLRAPFHIAKDYNAKTAVPVLKNVNYYNPLIKQHDAGTDTRDHEQSPHRNIQGNLQKPEFSNKKYQKACRYINKPEGCKTGSRCPFRHETYNQQRPNKRMKLGSAVTNQMNEQLLKEVSKKEVKTAIHQMDSNLALGPDVITNQMNEQLLKEVSKKEVKTAIFQMDSNLALGADVDSPAADESSLHSSYHISTDASCKINEPSGLGVAVKDVDSPAADESTLHSSCHISTDASCKIIEPSGSGVALSNVDDSPAADESSLHSSYLISTDAAWKIDKPSGLGVVIKDGNGRVLEAWSDSKHDLPSSMVAEAFALRWALSESLQRKWDNIRVISDCKTLVDYINGAGRCSYSSGCKDIGAEIILLKSNFRSCVVSFVPRSNNVHAHKLAQIGTSLTKKVCVKVLPE